MAITVRTRMCWTAVLLALFTLGCNVAHEQALEPEGVKDSLTLVRQGQLRLPLDSLTAPQTTCLQYLDPTLVAGIEVPTLSFLNPLTNSIYFYNLQDTALAAISQYPGNDKFPFGELYSYHVQSTDSIFVMNSSAYAIMLTNHEGTTFRQYWIVNDASGLEWPAHASTYHPLSIDRGALYVFNKQYGAPDFAQRQTAYDSTLILQIGLADTSYRQLGAYPPSFTTGVWGYRFHRDISFTHNPNTHQLVWSFLHDDALWTYDLPGGQMEKRYAGSPKVSGVSPHSTAQQYVPVDIMDQVSLFYNQAIYWPVFYDRYRNLYYRFYCLALSQEEMERGIDYMLQASRPAGVIILNGQLEKVGEVMLPNEVSLKVTASFVTPAGLYVAHMPEEEDFYVFEHLNIQPK